MDKMFKNSDGHLDFSKVFMAIATSIVLILQQWQTYRISELRTMGEIEQAHFMRKKEVNKRLDAFEEDRKELNRLKQQLLRLQFKIERLEQILIKRKG